MKKEFRVSPSCYKKNGKTMQSWLTFASSDGFYCIFADVNKNGHMYSSIKANKQLVINFPSADVYMKCYSTIYHNAYEEYLDEEKKGRYGKTGYLYNVHSPMNPENGKEEETYVATLTKYATYEQLKEGTIQEAKA